jgi:PPK2 family polyphosphate:nucleotide phosphotransferase
VFVEGQDLSKRLNLRRYQAGTSGRFKLRDHEPDFVLDGATSELAERMLAANVVRLRELQERLYSDRRWSLLIVLQGMDAAGKDGVIEHVFSGINPQGCTVHSFKAPSEEELDHDFLWRTTQRLPRRGHIGIFNRSQYEEVLIVRVLPELLHHQRLPREQVTKRIWRERFEDLVDHERHLARNGTVIRKIFLHVSKEEQRRRLLTRLDDPAKRWKASATDVEQRNRWKSYMRAYEEMIRETSTDDGPWYVVPADRKWWARLVVSAIVVAALADLGLKVPVVDPEQRGELDEIRRALQKGG